MLIQKADLAAATTAMLVAVRRRECWLDERVPPFRAGPNWLMPLTDEGHWGAAGQRCAWDAYLAVDTIAAPVAGVFAFCRRSPQLSRCTSHLAG